MSEKLELVPAEPQKPLPVVALDNPAGVVAGMLQAVLDKGITTENVAALKELSGLFERMQNKAAEQAFNKAFVALQQETIRVKAMSSVPNKDGSVRYVFAPYEDIMEQVQPVLVRHGFTISFTTRFEGPRVFKVCTLRHTAGHSVSNEFGVRIGSGPPSASEAQADGAAGTYAKRMALCDCLNIVIEKDGDARILGANITPEQARSLMNRVRATGSNEDAFLKFAQSPISDQANEADVVRAYEAIPSSMYAVLDASLKRKESTK